MARRLLILSSALLLLAACGRAPVPPVSLELVEFTPQGDGVAIDAVVTARFSGSVDSASLEESFILYGPDMAAVDVAFDWDPESKVATLVPREALAHATDYLVQVGGNPATGEAGLTAVTSWTFTTVSDSPVDDGQGGGVPGAGEGGEEPDNGTGAEEPGSGEAEAGEGGEEPGAGEGSEEPGTGEEPGAGEGSEEPGTGEEPGADEGEADVESPVMVFRSPEPGSTVSAEGFKLVIRFNELLDESTITSSAIKLNRGQHGDTSGHIDYDSETSTLTFTPFETLTSNRYKVIIDTAITDLAGNPVVDDTQWWFWVSE